MSVSRRVVIVGAGFGGLQCARALVGKPVDVVLIDRENYHLFTPLLYQVASSLLDPSDIAYPVRAVLRGADNVRFRIGDVVDVDVDAKAIATAAGDRIEYDDLVVATGSVTNFFGSDPLETHSYGLKTIPEALELRNHILRCFEAASRETDPERRRSWLEFVVVGGGPTGVEYAGALAELIRLVLVRDFPELDMGEVEIQLLEAGPRLLPAFDPSLGENARSELEERGIRVRLDTAVESAADHTVTLAGGEEMPARTLVWAAGVRVASLAADLPVDRRPDGRVPVDAHLRVEGLDDVYAIGDAAACIEDGEPIPMLSAPAMQQGRHVARFIVDRLVGAATPPFRYKDKGIMATIGRNEAVAQIGSWKFRGFLGWLMWLFVHIYYLIGYRNRIAVLSRWAWEYVFYDRPVRIIARARGRE